MSKNIFKITRKELKKVIKESLEKVVHSSPNRVHLFEMATIGAQKWGKDIYSIQIHGASTADSGVPHIHIYKYNDNTKKQFNFEISLIDLVSKDKITLIRQLDREKNINHKNKDKCSWRGYSDIYIMVCEIIYLVEFSRDSIKEYVSTTLMLPSMLGIKKLICSKQMMEEIQ